MGARLDRAGAFARPLMPEEPDSHRPHCEASLPSVPRAARRSPEKQQTCQTRRGGRARLGPPCRCLTRAGGAAEPDDAQRPSRGQRMPGFAAMMPRRHAIVFTCPSRRQPARGCPRGAMIESPGMKRRRPHQWQVVMVFTIQPCSGCHSLRRARVQSAGAVPEVHAPAGSEGGGGSTVWTGRGRSGRRAASRAAAGVATTQASARSDAARRARKFEADVTGRCPKIERAAILLPSGRATNQSPRRNLSPLCRRGRHMVKACGRDAGRFHGQVSARRPRDTSGVAAGPRPVEDLGREGCHRCKESTPPQETVSATRRRMTRRAVTC